MSTLRIGSCSWKFPSWHPLLYSAPQGINYLAEYGQRYTTVEIDQWFWSYFGPGKLSLPDVETVAEYLAATPESFRFTIKAPNAVTLTHAYAKRGGSAERRAGDGPAANPHFLSTDMYSRFLERIAPIRSRTACIMLQFEYLNRRKMPSLNAFLKHLDGFLCAGDRRWPLSVELRNPNYLKRELFELLVRHKVGFVFCHGYYMPPAPTLFREHFESGPARPLVQAPETDSPLPASPAVIRLLGPDRKGIEERTGKQWNQVVAPKDGELPEIASMALSILEQNVDVIINVNNHYEGSAPLTIGKLERMIDERNRRA